MKENGIRVCGVGGCFDGSAFLRMRARSRACVGGDGFWDGGVTLPWVNPNPNPRNPRSDGRKRAQWEAVGRMTLRVCTLKGDAGACPPRGMPPLRDDGGAVIRTTAQGRYRGSGGALTAGCFLVDPDPKEGVGGGWGGGAA